MKKEKAKVFKARRKMNGRDSAISQNPANLKKKKIEDKVSKKKAEFTNMKNKRFQTDKVNYALKVYY